MPIISGIIYELPQKTTLTCNHSCRSLLKNKCAARISQSDAHLSFLKAAWSIMKNHILYATSQQSCTPHNMKTLQTALGRQGCRHIESICFLISSFHSDFQHQSLMLTVGRCVLSAGLHVLILNELGGRSILYIISYVLIELFSF